MPVCGSSAGRRLTPKLAPKEGQIMEKLPDNVWPCERGGWPYYIVTQSDGTQTGYFDRDEAIAIAKIELIDDAILEDGE